VPPIKSFGLHFLLSALVILLASICAREFLPTLARDVSTATRDLTAITDPKDSADVDYGQYMADVEWRIKSVWNPPFGNESKQTEVSFKIHRDGSVSDIEIEKTCGVAAADAAALKAVKDAAPFRALPAGAPAAVDIEFTFQYNPFGNESRTPLRGTEESLHSTTASPSANANVTDARLEQDSRWFRNFLKPAVADVAVLIQFVCLIKGIVYLAKGLRQLVSCPDDTMKRSAKALVGKVLAVLIVPSPTIVFLIGFIANNRYLRGSVDASYASLCYLGATKVSCWRASAVLLGR